MTLDLSNKTAVVTGASRGIGMEVVKKLASSSCNVLALTRSEDPNLITQFKIFESEFGVSISRLYLDFESKKSILDVGEYLVHNKINVDILINNAAHPFGALFNLTSEIGLRKVFEINFFGPFLLTQLISKLMIKNKSGCIINISSIAADLAMKGMSAYGSSKAAFSLVNEILAMELGSSGINVNTILPGPIQTEMLDSMDEKAKAELISRVALGRPGTVEEVANLVCFLAGNQSPFIHGAKIRIDGGIK